MSLRTHQGRTESVSADALGGGVRHSNHSAQEAQSVPTHRVGGSLYTETFGGPVASGLRLGFDPFRSVPSAGSW
jgi:hypothetical protein